jgi:hypothetical protein
MILENKIRLLVRDIISEGFNDHSEVIDVIDGIKIRRIESDYVAKKYPVWNKYLGSHHYGKKSSHIPKDEIWISDKVLDRDLGIVIQHEVIERAIMRALQKFYGMTPEESWEIGHNISKKLGF